MDEFYQEYQDNTSDNRPSVKLGLEPAKPQAFNRVLEEIKCVNKLEIKNRKRIKELNENLILDRRDKALTKKDFESYERKVNA